MKPHARLVVRAIFVVLACATLAPAQEEPEPKPVPCTATEYRQFDFWIGEWDVFDPDGKHVGRNRIERILDGCLLLENWTGDHGGSGKSVNYFDPAAGKWKQHWIDDHGRIIEVAGGLTDRTMAFRGKLIRPDDETLDYRMSFEPSTDGRVRQYIEVSADGAKTWRVWFDGIYVRTETAAPAAGR